MMYFKLLKGFALRLTDERTNGRTDICNCRVAFATENIIETSGQSVTINNTNNLAPICLE